MDSFVHLDRLLRDFRWSLLQVQLVETLAFCAFLAVVLAGTGVALCAGFSEAGPVRMVVVALGGSVVLGAIGQLSLHAFRLFRNPVGVVEQLRLAYPEIGPGLETVVRLRPMLDRGSPPPPFSEALLIAEAARAISRLERLPPRPPADLARTRRFIVATACAVAILIAVTTARPADVARGVRLLTGIGSVPGWMALPEEDADLLAYDIRTSWVIVHPDGSRVRVAAGETADILAPPGVVVEVTGSLTRPIRQGNAVVTSDGLTVEIPLALTSEEGFRFVLPEVQDGLWFLDVVTSVGTRVREKTRRKIARIAAEPPKVAVEPQGLVFVKPDGAATIAYSVESRIGVARLEALVRFPFAPTRPPVRVSLKTPVPGEHLVRGEMRFTWPEDPAMVAGRADLEIEAQDWLLHGSRDVGGGPRVRFVLDTNVTRRLAEIEEGDHLLGEMARALDEYPLVSVRGGASVLALTASPERSLWGAAVGATNTYEWSHVVERARKALAGISAAAALSGGPTDEDIRALETATLDLEAAVRWEWASFTSLRLADLERESARWRTVPEHLDPRWIQGLRDSLSRTRHTLSVLYGLDQREMQRGDPASTHRVTSYRRAEVGTKARDEVAVVLDLLSSPVDRLRLLQALGRCIASVETVLGVYRASLSPIERVAFGGIVVSPEVSTAVKDVIEAQREVHDRTSQAAFEWKNRTDLLAAGLAPDPRDMHQRIGEAQRSLDRIPLERLEPPEAAEVARMREDLKAVMDLVDASDFASALDQARNLVERMTRTAAEMGDEAEWLEREPGSAIRGSAARSLGLAARSLREVTRILAAWKSRAEVPPTSAMRAEVMEILAGQNRVISALDKAVEPLGRHPGAWMVELVGMAASARRNMIEAAARLAEERPSAAEVHQRQAVQDLLRLKRALDRGPFETLRRRAMKPETEPVTLPTLESRPPADELLEEIRRYHQERPRPGTEDLVRAYYESLLK